jgi:MFS family permease
VAASSGLALYLGVVQFFFATTWTLYVIYLPQLAQEAGIGRQWVPWILVADQVVFALMDTITGFWVDRVRSGLARLGGWMLAVTALSCAAFVLLPFAGATLLLALILVWAVTSSALRSPAWVLLARYAGAPAVPWLSALVLAGSALAAAVAPYLGIALRGVDPRVPFVVSTLTLLAAVGGLVLVERRIAGTAQSPAPQPELDLAAPGAKRAVAMFFAGLFVAAVGFQVHFSLNSAPQYLRFAAGRDLQYLMPVFWIGFNVLVFPASAVAVRFGALPTMAAAAALGAMASLGALLAPSLPALIAAQFVAGGCWGAVSVAAYTAAIAFGRDRRLGAFLGTLFALLALAAFARIAGYAADLVVVPEFKATSPWIPQFAWLLAALLLLGASRRGMMRAGEGR